MSSNIDGNDRDNRGMRGGFDNDQQMEGWEYLKI
jgi:hypothetical protein